MLHCERVYSAFHLHAVLGDLPEACLDKSQQATTDAWLCISYTALFPQPSPSNHPLGVCVLLPPLQMYGAPAMPYGAYQQVPMAQAYGTDYGGCPVPGSDSTMCLPSSS